MTSFDSNRPPRRARPSAALRALLPLLAGLGQFATAADEGARLAMDHGCLNCHWSQSHSAPSLTRLAEKMSKKGDQPEVLRHRLDEMRHEGNVHGHQMVSDESALLILAWLAHGGK